MRRKTAPPLSPAPSSCSGPALPRKRGEGSRRPPEALASGPSDNRSVTRVTASFAALWFNNHAARPEEPAIGTGGRRRFKETVS